MFFPEDQHTYCWDCYLEWLQNGNWKDYIAQTRPTAVVWRWDTKDVITAFCPKHKQQFEKKTLPRYEKYYRDVTSPDWHPITERAN